MLSGSGNSFHGKPSALSGPNVCCVTERKPSGGRVLESKSKMVGSVQPQTLGSGEWKNSSLSEYAPAKVASLVLERFVRGS